MPPRKRKRKSPAFDPSLFLFTTGLGRTMLSIPEDGTIFSQGDSCDAVFYIQTGRVKLTVVSKTGKEATIAVLDAGAFFGEDGLMGHRLRMGSAKTLTDCSLMRISKKAMLSTLHSQIFRHFCRVSVGEEHSLPRRPDRSTLQFQ